MTTESYGPRGPLSPDPRVAVLLLLAMALVFLPLTGGNTGSAPAPLFGLDRDGMVRRLPARGAAAAGQGIPDTLPPAVALFFNRPFRINQAGRATLTMLPGIGPHLADRILSFRASHGPITSSADLLRIRGIGPDRVARLAPLLSYR